MKILQPELAWPAGQTDNMTIYVVQVPTHI